MNLAQLADLAQWAGIFCGIVIFALVVLLAAIAYAQARERERQRFQGCLLEDRNEQASPDHRW